MPNAWESAPEVKAPAWESAPEVQQEAKPEDWQARVKPIDLAGGKRSVQRDDGGVWFGPEQGNTGKPGWFDAQGNRLGDAPGKPTAFMDRLTNDLTQKAKAQEKLPLMGQIVPGQVSGMAKGLIDTAVAPVQFAAHIARSNAVDPLVDALDQNYRQNWQTSKGGEVLGQAIPFLATAGGSAAPQAATKALTAGERVRAALASIGKAGATGAVAAPALTPETNVQSEGDFWQRKKGEATVGGVMGAGLGAVAPTLGLLRGARAGAERMGKTPAPAEMLDELGGRLGGKAPGEALQDAATAKYNAAWDEFKAAVAPVDAEAGLVGVDYSGPINTLKQVLGVGQKRPPMPLPKERQEVLEGLLRNLEEAGKPDGLVDNSFQGAIDTIKWLGSEQRRLAVAHKDTEARAMLSEVRDSILKAMEDSSPELSQKATEARRVFATKVAPLFDKSEGGNFLTQIRDTATPGDLLASGNQGSLARMKPDRAAIIAKGSSADPMLYSYLDAAINQAKGNPRIFSDSLKKAMPAIEAIADPETLKAFQGMVKVADTSKGAGVLANLGLAAVPGYHEAGATVGMALNFKPAMSGPGLIWKTLQSPATRKLLALASKLPSGSPELELIVRDLSKRTAPVAGRGASNVQPFTPAKLPAAADSGNADTVAQQ